MALRGAFPRLIDAGWAFLICICCMFRTLYPLDEVDENNMAIVQVVDVMSAVDM